MTERLLVCTDLDRTLIPNGPQPESPKARRLFSALIARPEVALVYVTGRHRSLIETAIANYVLPKPDFVIGDVGTTIYRVGTSEDWVSDSDWEDEIRKDWGAFSHAQLKNLLAELAELRLQERSKQNRFKLSYYVSLHSDRIGLAAAIREKLEAEGLVVSLVWSINEPAGVGLLDVLPARASKLNAIEFLRLSHGFDLTETVFSGCSGNDMEVFTSQLPSVLVANSKSEVKDQARKRAQAKGNEGTLYIAQGGFMGMNGNYGAGIVEGIVYYHPNVLDWFGGKQ